MGEEGRTYISRSIPAGVSVTLDGSMKVLIRQVNDPPPPGKQFLERDTLTVQATMPWLNRKLEGFTFNKAIDIEYPVELQKIKFLPTLAQGSRSNVTWEVGLSLHLNIYYAETSPSRRSIRESYHWVQGHLRCVQLR